MMRSKFKQHAGLFLLSSTEVKTVALWLAEFSHSPCWGWAFTVGFWLWIFALYCTDRAKFGIMFPNLLTSWINNPSNIVCTYRSSPYFPDVKINCYCLCWSMHTTVWCVCTYSMCTSASVASITYPCRFQGARQFAGGYLLLAALQRWVETPPGASLKL